MSEDDINLILKELRGELKKQEDALADYHANYVETEAEWITEGWTEALTFAIRIINNRLNKGEI